MKNLNVLLISALASLTFTNIQAQDRETPKIGAKGGLMISNIYDKEGEDFEASSKLGYAVGGYFSIPINKVIGIQPEVMLVQKGFKSTGTFLGSEYELNRTTTHLDIPIQFALKPTKNLTLLIGPQYSYMLSRNDKVTYGSLSASDQEEFENDNIRKNTLGLIGGLDINLNTIVLSGRTGWDFQKNNGDGTPEDIRYKNFWVQFTLGVNLVGNNK